MMSKETSGPGLASPPVVCSFVCSSSWEEQVYLLKIYQTANCDHVTTFFLYFYKSIRETAINFIFRQ